MPNAITLVRLLCLPLFVYLLFGRDNRAGASLLLGCLGATDWVDGYIARHFGQVSEFGKMFDPTVDRLLFFVGTSAIIIEGAGPRWFLAMVLVRELAVGATIAVATLALHMRRFDVTRLGKLATFLLMFAVPGFLLGASEISTAGFYNGVSWVLGIPGLVLAYVTAVGYWPKIRAGVRAGRQAVAHDELAAARSDSEPA